MSCSLTKGAFALLTAYALADLDRPCARSSIEAGWVAKVAIAAVFVGLADPPPRAGLRGFRDVPVRRLCQRSRFRLAGTSASSMRWNWRKLRCGRGETALPRGSQAHSTTTAAVVQGLW